MTKIINMPGQLTFAVVRGQQTVEMRSPFGNKTISRKDCAAILKGLRFARRSVSSR